MIDMANILIRRVNSRGSTYEAPVPHDDLPCAVLEAVECEVIETGEDEGRVSVGGQSWQWQKGETVYVVRDAAGEYVRDESGTARTPASNEAYEFETIAAARDACTRATDAVLARYEA